MPPHTFLGHFHGSENEQDPRTTLTGCKTHREPGYSRTRERGRRGGRSGEKGEKSWQDERKGGADTWRYLEEN